MDEFEQFLKQQPLRQVPDSWRREILQAAQPVGPATADHRWWRLALPALAATGLVVIAVQVLNHPRPTPVPAASIDMPVITLASGWRIKPTGQAAYQVLRPDLIRLDRGEMFVESAPLAGATATRLPLNIETPAGNAIAKGTKFYIGTHADNPKGNPQMNNINNINKLTRILVLSGMVTLANARGEATGHANDLVVAESGKAPASHAIAANGDFAVDLYAALAKENPGKNLFFSPYSMSSALAMTAEGARGETADQMGKVLRFPRDARHIGGDAQLLPWNTALVHTGMADLNERFKGKDQYELRVANTLYGEKTYPFQQSYLDTINKFYGTGAVVPVDFKNDFEKVRGQINARVEKQTNQRIKDLIAKGGLNDLTRLVLVNAIYFKGEWAMPFDEKATKPEDFLAGTERKVTVPMMRKDGMDGARYGAFTAAGGFFQTPRRVSTREEPDPRTLYPGNDGFVVAELPYKGKELSMVVIVPRDADGLGALEAKLTSANLQGWLGKLESREVNVHLPKFKLETDYQKMGDTLKAMGMTRAFTDPSLPGGAQFDGMCASSDPMLKLYIAAVMHKAFVEVNEKGTEAAAATAVVMAVAKSIPRDRPFTPTFRADKPFLFAIRDVKTGTILFLGRVMDPAK